MGRPRGPDHRTFTAAISVPLTLALPIIAILSVTSEWSQRTGLTTFALVPHRGRIVLAKAIASVLLAIVAIPVAFTIGALGNVVGTAIAGVDPVWNLTATDLLLLVLADVLGVLVGFMLAVLIRSSPGALATYFVYAFLLPTLALILAESQDVVRTSSPGSTSTSPRTPSSTVSSAASSGRSSRSPASSGWSCHSRSASGPSSGPRSSS